MPLTVKPWLKNYWIYCSLKWMPDHVKEYSFDVIKFTMRANESCFDEFKFCKTLMKVFRLYWMFTVIQISLLRMHFTQLNDDLRIWTYFRICLTFRANDCVFSLNEMQKVYYFDGHLSFHRSFSAVRIHDLIYIHMHSVSVFPLLTKGTFL